tara:strand:+ start:1626 stop:3728 length:2103 start_codon:yes stop_codon:yes gene_type:complete
MATRQNTPRQNYGNPFSAGSSVAQGAALAAPGFVDYSQFFDTSATAGLQAAQQGLFTQIALANEQHAKNMENILPADFDETKLAPGSVDGTYEMLRALKDQAFNLSRQAANLRGTKEGDMAQMELNKIKSQMSKHYGNNVEYNSMMLDHNKNKDYYSQSFNVIPGKAEEYQRYVKFVDPSAKISYDGKTMMIESEDGDKISFEELKKLEPAMQETEAVLGIDQLATTIVTEAGNGKKVNDATIDFTVASIFNKAYQEGGDRLNVLTSLATDMSKEVGGQKFDFYNYLKSSNDLAGKYLNPDGSFNIPEDPSARAEYAKSFESDFKNYLKETMQTVRDSGIEAYTKDVREEEERKINLEVEKQRKILGFRNQNNRKEVDFGMLDNVIDVLKTSFDEGDMFDFAKIVNDTRNIEEEGSYELKQVINENGDIVPGKFELFMKPPGAKSVSAPTGDIIDISGDAKSKKREFDRLMLFVTGDISDAYYRTDGPRNKTSFSSDVTGETQPSLSFDPSQLSSLENIDNMNSKELGTLIDKIDNQNQDTQSFGEGGATYTIDGQTLTETDKTNLLNSLNKIQEEKTGLENEDDDVKKALKKVTSLQHTNFRNSGLNKSDGSVNYQDTSVAKVYDVLEELDEILTTRTLSPNARTQIEEAIEYLKKLSDGQVTDVSQLKYMPIRDKKIIDKILTDRSNNPDMSNQLIAG